MTVKEYIELLQKMPQDIEVVVEDPGCGCCSSNELESADTPQIKVYSKFDLGLGRVTDVRNVVRIA